MGKRELAEVPLERPLDLKTRTPPCQPTMKGSMEDKMRKSWHIAGIFHARTSVGDAGGLRAARKDTVSATKAVETQGRGGLATKAVESQGKGGVVTSCHAPPKTPGSSSTRSREFCCRPSEQQHTGTCPITLLNNS